MNKKTPPQRGRPSQPPHVEDQLFAVLRRAIQRELDRGETARGIASRCGVSQPSISRMLSGRRRGVSLTNARRIASTLGVDLGGLF